MNKLSFKLEVFEGPLDLLMHLIEKNKVNIYDIPIAEITDQYLGYLERMEEMDLELSSEFLMMAANLLYIKSRMLLPKYSDPEEEEDPRQELVDKLLEYQKYKRISEYFGDRQHQYNHILYKEPEEIELPERDEYEGFMPLSVEDLIKAFDNIFLRKSRLAPPSEKAFEKIVKYELISIKAKAAEILEILKQNKRVRFTELFEALCYRPEIVARFLAVLELIRDHRILAVQKAIGKDIYLLRVDHKEREMGND